MTWLQGGALGFYNNAYAIRVEQASQAINVPSVMSAVGGAISAGAKAFGEQNRFDAKLAFEYDKLGAQLGAITGRKASSAGADWMTPASNVLRSAQSALGGTGGNIYSAGSETVRQIGGAVSAYGFSNQTMKQPPLERGEFRDKAQDTPYTNAWERGNIDKNFPDAEAITNRYGEPAEWLYSPVVGVADFYRNVRGKSVLDDLVGEGTSPRDLTDFFSGDLRRNWAFFSRNSPAWMQPAEALEGSEDRRTKRAYEPEGFGPPVARVPEWQGPLNPWPEYFGRKLTVPSWGSQ